MIAPIRAPIGAMLLAALVLFAQPVAAADAKPGADSIRFDVAVAPDAARHLELLAYPAYAAVALENVGVSPSNSSRVIVKDGRTLQFRNAVVKYIERKGALFSYEATVEWGLGVTQASFKLPLEVDAAALGEGRVTVRVQLPLAKYLPEELPERIGLKLQSLATPEVQAKLLAYLDAAAARPHQQSGTAGLIEQIMIDAYNHTAAGQPAAGGREPGDAEPLSEQIALIATLAIWLVLVPGGVLARRYWLRRKARRVTG